MFTTFIELKPAGEWHRWFAWHPVRLQASPVMVGGKLVWLRQIERRLVGHNRTYIPHCLGLRHLGADRPDYEDEPVWEYKHVRRQ